MASGRVVTAFVEIGSGAEDHRPGISDGNSDDPSARKNVNQHRTRGANAPLLAMTMWANEPYGSCVFGSRMQAEAPGWSSNRVRSSARPFTNSRRITEIETLRSRARRCNEAISR